MNEELLRLILELGLALVSLAISIFILASRQLRGLGACLLGAVGGGAFWLAIWLEWFRLQHWSWWSILGSTALVLYAGAIIGAVAWSYLDDQRERRDTMEEEAKMRHRVLGPPVH